VPKDTQYLMVQEKIQDKKKHYSICKWACSFFFFFSFHFFFNS